MKKISLIAITVLFTLAPLSASINLFRTSLPAQAGVNSVFVFDTWDYIVTPAFYSWQTDDTVSAVYTPDQYDRNTFVMGGRNTVGLPIYWAVGLKNERAKSQNYDTTNSSSLESTTGENRFRISLGTEIAGFGIGLFGEYLNNSTLYSNTTNGSTYTANAGLTNNTPNRIRAGVNLGQSIDKKVVWSVGAAVRQNGGSYSFNNGTTTLEGVSSLTLTGGRLARPQNTTDAEVSTFGWITLTERGERAYWRGNFSYQLKGEVGVKQTTGATVTTATIDEDANNGNLFLGYAMAWPLSETARFYFGPEVGVEYSSVKTFATNGANGFTGSNLGFTANSQRLQEGNTTFAGKLNLPIVFQLPVVANLLSLQAGWYPEITVYSVTQREQTNNIATNPKVVDVESTRYLRANVEKYGAGLTYTPVNRLKIHLLFTTITNDDPNVTATDRVDISRVSVGVDYVFASDDGAKSGS
ncbi:MAG: hypothetical protein KDK38_03515 [Leptospiraceae bacterium]|nr:hypothetical protein [Leptospiraceae bacterium]